VIAESFAGEQPRKHEIATASHNRLIRSIACIYYYYYYYYIV